VSVLGSESEVVFEQGLDMLKVDIKSPVYTEFPICLKMEFY